MAFLRVKNWPGLNRVWQFRPPHLVMLHSSGGLGEEGQGLVYSQTLSSHALGTERKKIELRGSNECSSWFTVEKKGHAAAGVIKQTVPVHVIYFKSPKRRPVRL